VSAHAIKTSAQASGAMSVAATTPESAARGR
jgi:hypothetical protein